MDLAPEQLRVVQDEREQVVEVVRDATREPGDVLEAARLHELTLELLALAIGARALERAHEDLACDAQERDVRLGPALGPAHRVEAHEPLDPVGRDHRDREHRPHALRLEHRPLARGLRRQIGDRGHVHDLVRLHEARPPRHDGDLQALQVVDLRLDALRAPLVGVVHRGAVRGEAEDVRAVDTRVLADRRQRAVELVVDRLPRQVHEARGERRDELLEREPLAQRVLVAGAALDRGDRALDATVCGDERCERTLPCITLAIDSHRARATRERGGDVIRSRGTQVRDTDGISVEAGSSR